MTNREVAVILIGEEKTEIVPAELDGLGAVSVNGATTGKKWLPGKGDWTKAELPAEWGKKKREVPAIIAYPNRIQPVAARVQDPDPKKPSDLLQVPANLNSYVKANHLLALYRASEEESATVATELGAFLKRVPRWVWFVVLGLVVVLYTIFKSDLGVLFDRLR